MQYGGKDLVMYRFADSILSKRNRKNKELSKYDTHREKKEVNAAQT